MRTTIIAMLLLAAGGPIWQSAGGSGLSGQAIAAEAAAPAAGQTAAREEPPVPVVVIESRARPTAARLILRGRTLANRNVQVAAQTSGRVVSDPLRRGARVSEGDVLCRLDPGIRQAELDEAEAVLAEARVEAEAATRLKEKGFAPETTYKARQAQLQAAQARLDRVLWDIQQLEIRAPFDGFLETDTAELGSLLVPGALCANVIDLSKVKIVGFVAEQEVDELSVGQKAIARLINGIETEGEISFISRVADAQTRTYAVEVTLPNEDGRIRDGMTAELLIDLAGEEGHFLPQSALTLNDDGRLGVRIDEDGIARFVPVTVLRDETDGFWVTGLPEVANVIVVGQEFVTDGRRVIGSPPGWEASQ